MEGKEGNAEHLRHNPLTEALEERFKEALHRHTFEGEGMVASEGYTETVVLEAADGRIFSISRPVLDLEGTGHFDYGLSVYESTILEVEGKPEPADHMTIYTERNDIWYVRAERNVLQPDGTRVKGIELIPVQDYTVAGLAKDIKEAEIKPADPEEESNE